jgi:hypothetical protein
MEVLQITCNIPFNDIIPQLQASFLLLVNVELWSSHAKKRESIKESSDSGSFSLQLVFSWNGWEENVWFCLNESLCFEENNRQFSTKSAEDRLLRDLKTRATVRQIFFQGFLVISEQNRQPSISPGTKSWSRSCYCFLESN